MLQGHCGVAGHFRSKFKWCNTEETVSIIQARWGQTSHLQPSMKPWASANGQMMCIVRYKKKELD